MAVVAASLLPFTHASAANTDGGPIPVDRRAGDDRYETSLKIAERFVQESGGSVDSAVLVSGSSWSDAVVASGFAASVGAPVVLAGVDGLTDEAETFLKNVGVKNLYVVGSFLLTVFNPGVLDGLSERFAKVGIISGSAPDRYIYSAQVAFAMGTPGELPGHGRTVIVATGQNFPDALVAGGYSARGGHPVLLANEDALGDAVAAYLRDSGTQTAVIMGGKAAVAPQIEAEIKALGIKTQRMAGIDRFETARKTAEFFEGKYQSSLGDSCFDRSTSGLARADVPFDAFSAGPLLAKLCAPLLLSTVKKLDTKTAAWLHARTDQLVVFGGQSAVSDAALEPLSTATLPCPTNTTEAQWVDHDFWKDTTLAQVLYELRCGADATAVNEEFGNVPLHLAAAHVDEITILEALVDAGGDVNAKNASSVTALHFAAIFQSDEAIVQWLIDVGLDVGAPLDDIGLTPLHWAARSNHGGIVSLLLAAGADVNASDTQNGWTALHHAARTNNTDVVSVLLAAGASTTAEDSTGHTPLEVAEASDSADVVKLLRSATLGTSVQ